MLSKSESPVRDEPKKVEPVLEPKKRAESPPQFFRVNEDDGLEYEVVNVFGHSKLLEAVKKTGSIKRYINPKMERELLIFKKKITARHEQKAIPNSYRFPRKSDIHPIAPLKKESKS